MGAPPPLQETLEVLHQVEAANRAGRGLLGPAVYRDGPVAVLEELVLAGLLQRRDTGPTLREFGYWITPAGTAALNGTP